MKINRASPLTSTASRPGSRGRSDKASGFARALSSGPASAGASASGAAAVGRIDDILSLQEVSSDAIADREARQRGEEVLDRLDDLRLALLDGRLPVAAVERLVQMAASRRAQARDPRLAEILAEIELRAAVELAKLGR